ncbi:MAG: hypothetical protein HKN12_01460 [Gemmatimonadetes bacterium]|nr:hypothetical protein [Gemmatimonadota bacterium]
MTLMTAAGMNSEVALAISLSSYAIAVTQGLLGGAVHLYREVRERNTAPAPDDITPEDGEPAA